jgi:hypothetical protein
MECRQTTERTPPDRRRSGDEFPPSGSGTRTERLNVQPATPAQCPDHSRARTQHPPELPDRLGLRPRIRSRTVRQRPIGSTWFTRNRHPVRGPARGSDRDNADVPGSLRSASDPLPCIGAPPTTSTSPPRTNHAGHGADHQVIHEDRCGPSSAPVPRERSSNRCPASVRHRMPRHQEVRARTATDPHYLILVSRHPFRHPRPIPESRVQPDGHGPARTAHGRPATGRCGKSGILKTSPPS